MNINFVDFAKTTVSKIYTLTRNYEFDQCNMLLELKF